MLAKKLKLGDTIGIISPASYENAESIKKNINYLKNLGFNIKEGKYIYNKLGYLAGKDKNRADDLINMFLDKNVSMILCTRGGYGSMRILPYIDFNIIKNNPKIFAGFSDITILLNVIYDKCNLITFHSPMLTSNLKDKETLKNFLYTIMKGYEAYTITNPTNIPLKCLIKGTVTGTLIGGNLSLLCSTLGTPYSINTKNKILFIEEINEEPYKIDRMLTQLLLSNKLQNCKGFILGQFKNCRLPNYKNSLSLYEIIKNRILTLNKPTLSNFMAGHCYPKLTLPIGSKIQLDCNLGKIKILNPIIK